MGSDGIITRYEIEVWLSLVERYVRDVEVASSNLVTSTKKRRSTIRYSFSFCLMRQFDLGCCSATTASSHSPPEDRQARLSGAGRVNLRRKANTLSYWIGAPERIFAPFPLVEVTFSIMVVQSTTASSHSPPEDRQARLSGAGRGYHGAKRSYLVTSTKKQLKTSYFDLFSAVFLYIFLKIGCFQLTTCLPDFLAFLLFFPLLFHSILKIPFICFLRLKF